MQDYSIGALVTPSIGLRFGGNAGAFFGTPTVSFPMLVGTAGFDFRVLPGVTVGGAW